MDHLRAKMDALSARFAGQAEQHRAELAEACKARDCDAVIVKAHKLAGIAPMFGYTDIGEAALALEEAAESGEVYDAEAARLDSLLADLQA
ncbi:Hpt domain-containing protein [Qipengyuania atrilutea]|uniref:Hpt domain-containing protein n=1 Tax=Qipengyuania atrilutea TaxID=2744473 RepID=A0A850H1R7_9SPHN|nr:Hpt domain-containing protein [Actirhodobacter atriluteus]NVD45934.1 Hpt domain-containing protein [Actirhodobacter atriluteus]